jgi:tetraacyldisaccharide 4'-kinase
MREPAFWWREVGIAARLLAPLAAVYGAVAGWRLRQPGVRAGVPVVCIGNLTVGGAGKTPTALAVARMLEAAGEQPAFLTRGYGGALAGPLLVDPARQRAVDVGDEPLLLTRTAPTIVARDRALGARMAVAAGAGVIVMDDGFQNPSLAKDFSVLIVDGRRGIGNARVIPAGPLRAPLAQQLARAHALIVVGTTSAPVTELIAQAQARGIPVFAARLAPDESFIAALGRGRVLAFAGIGDPKKFFWTLTDAGIAVAAVRSFPDHHRYSAAEAEELSQDADREGLVLVTTEKDHVRLAGDERLAELAAHAHPLPVTLAIDDEDELRRLVLNRLVAARQTIGQRQG